MTLASVGLAAGHDLVGRKRELAVLRAALDGATRGQGRVWLVGGEPGIGKTRLLEALAETMASAEVGVLWGRCWEGGGAPAYWPWSQVLLAAAEGTTAKALAVRLGSGAAAVASLAPELTTRLSGLAPAPVAEGPGARFRLFDAVARFLFRTATDVPLLIALDDVHAADEASLLLLEFVASQAPRSHLVVVATYREAEVAASPRLTDLVSRVARHGARLTLGGLARSEVEALFRAMAPVPATGELVTRIHEATEGNPFLVKEVARLLSHRRGRPHTGKGLPLPHEARAIVAGRLRSVPVPLRRVLEAAAVLGREFDVASLAALVGHDPASVVDALGDARRQGVVDELGAGRWVFAHALLREALLDELAPSARAELHLRAADALQGRPGSDPGTRRSAIAHHRYEAASAGVDTGAAEACAAAGAQAVTALAFEDAAGWYERALEALALSSVNDERRRFDLLMALGRARFQAGQFRDARSAYSEAMDRARSLGSAQLLAEAALEFFAQHRDDRNITLLEEALSALPELDSALRARVLLFLGETLLGTRPEEWRRWQEMCDDGLAMARRVGDAHTLLQLLLHWSRCHWDCDPFGVEARLAVLEEARRVSEQSGRAGEWAKPLVHWWRFCHLLTLGRIAHAREEADVASADAQRLHAHGLTAVATFMRATLSLLSGDLDIALDLEEQAAQLDTGPDDHDRERIARVALFVHRQKGEFDEARNKVEQARPPSSPFGAYWRLSYRADALLSAVDLGESTARQDLGALVSDALSLPGPPLDPDVLVRLAEASWLLGVADQAVALYDRLRAYAGRLVIYKVLGAPLGAADRHLGQLAALLGRYDEAEVHFETAHNQHRRWGARSFLAHGQADHARAVLARDAPGDRRRAAELAEEAAAGYRALGMVHYEESARRLRARVGSKVSPSFVRFVGRTGCVRGGENGGLP